MIMFEQQGCADQAPNDVLVSKDAERIGMAFDHAQVMFDLAFVTLKILFKCLLVDRWAVMEASGEKAKPRSFTLSEDYTQLLSGAHRKPATPIGAPALVAHFGFWQNPGGPPQKDFTIDKGATAEDDEWSRRTDFYIRAIYLLVKDSDFDTPNTDRGGIANSRYIFLFKHVLDINSQRLLTEVEFLQAIGQQKKDDSLFSTRYQTVAFSFTWHNIKIRLSFEKHQEYFTLTSFMDLSLVSNDDGDDHFNRNVQKGFFDFVCDLEAYNKELRESEISGKDIADDFWRERFNKHHKLLYSESWDIFLDEVLLSTTEITREAPTVYQCQSDLGTVFADFRGLVLAPPHPDEKSRGQSTILQMPRWRKPEITQEHWLGDRLTQETALDRIRDMWPFVTSEQLVPLRRKEFTASRMLKGHALYITALGAQPAPYLGSFPPRETDRVPVYYLIYTTTYSQWQIGRLVDRINHQGTVRIAAIHELEKLIYCGDQLRQLSIPNEAQGIKEVQERIDSWDRTLFPSTGLSYRIERSRYYVRQFMDGLTQLRIKRIEGYQPYDLFVLRRLAATFDFIDRLGVRLDRFRNRLETNALSSTALSLQSAQRNLTKNTEQLVDLQKFAELVLWCFLVPYYISGSLEHIFERIPGLNPEETHVVWQIAVVHSIIWIVCISYGITRFVQLSAKSEEVIDGKIKRKPRGDGFGVVLHPFRRLCRRPSQIAPVVNPASEAPISRGDGRSGTTAKVQ